MNNVTVTYDGFPLRTLQVAFGNVVALCTLKYIYVLQLVQFVTVLLALTDRH